jgi:hypothetical protein
VNIPAWLPAAWVKVVRHRFVDGPYSTRRRKAKHRLRDLDQKKGRDRLAAWVSERMADGEAPDPIAGQAEQVVPVGATSYREPRCLPG